MEEIKIRSHLIVTDVHEEYHVKWCGKVLDAKHKKKNGEPIFVVVSSGGRIEINTTDMKRVEKCAKLLTRPKGRQAITSDTARIYLLEEDDNEKLMGILIHDHVKTFAPMYDTVGWE